MVKGGASCGLFARVVGVCLLFLSLSVFADILTPEERQWLDTAPEIRFAPAPNYPPVEFFDENNIYRGITADFVRHMREVAGINLKVVQLQSWNQVIEKSKKREVDVWGAAARTEERETYMNFTEPYIRLPAVIIVRREIAGELTMPDLDGKRLVTIKNYASEQYVQEHYPNLELVSVPDIETGLRMVSFGLADAIVATNASAIYYIEKEGLTNLRVAGESGFEWHLRFAARNDWPELVGILQKGLDSISEEKQREIYRRWISLGGSQWAFTWEFAAKLVVLVAITLLVGILLWNRMLRQRVASRTRALNQELREREVLECELRRLATTDELTGAFNRRRILELASDELVRAQRYDSDFSMALLDLDYFKKVNDTYGHPTGDLVLKSVVRSCKEQLRDCDLLGRLGGEEFVILLPETGEEDAVQAIDRVRLAVEAMSVVTADQNRIHLTVSAGISSYDGNTDAVETMLGCCDRALYEAKESGRNRLVVCNLGHEG
ncbi:MAG: diguanylate cyclase [Candidatus Sedimenticola sp. 6PFRAG7]